MSKRSLGHRLKLNTPFDTDHEDQLLLSRNVEGTILLSQAGQTNLLTLLITVLLDVLLGALEDDTTLLLLGLRGGQLRPNISRETQVAMSMTISDPKDG